MKASMSITPSRCKSKPDKVGSEEMESSKESLPISKASLGEHEKTFSEPRSLISLAKTLLKGKIWRKKAKKMAKEVQESLDQKKIANFQDRIDHGDYSVDSVQVADQLVEEHIKMPDKD